LAREKGAKGRESRLRLLHAAAKQFAIHGFHETKVSSIVAEAKLSQPAFYLYFESKDAVFEELVKLFHVRLTTVINESRLPEINSTDGVLNQLCHTLTLMFDYFYANPYLTRIGFHLAPQSQNMKQELVQWVEQMLSGEQRSGQFKSDFRMNMVAECLVGTIERIVFTQLLPGKVAPEQLALDIVNLYVSGIGMKQSKV